MSEERHRKQIFLLLIGLIFVMGAATAAHAQLRTLSLDDVKDSVTCRIGHRTHNLTPDKYRIQFNATSKETQLFFEEVAPYTDLTSYLYALPVTDTPNVEICPADGGMNYIAYNANWLLAVYKDTNSKWTLYAIIAHELGHYARAHDRISIGSNPKIELAADEYAGEVLAKMRASLQDALAAFHSDKIGDHRGDDSHPSLRKRLEAVEKGWRKVKGTEESGEGSSGADKSSNNELDPSKDEGAFGPGIYEFWYVTFTYDANGQATVQNRENQRHTVTAKPQINERYVWGGKTWKVYTITGSRVWLSNLDPSKDEGAFGDGMFEFWYVTFTYDGKGGSTVQSRENVLYKVTTKPQINDRFIWQGQTWKVYTITGSRVWLSNLNPSEDEGAFGDNVYEFWYVKFSYDSSGNATVRSRENKLYTVTRKPQLNECYTWEGKCWKVYSITGSRVWLSEPR